MGSDARHTSTEKIAHAVCDRFQVDFPSPGELREWFKGITESHARRIADAADRVPISVGYALDFTVSAKLLAEVQRAANQTRTTHFIGVFDNGTEISGCDRKALLELGCEKLAWITPERAQETAVRA